MYNLFGPAFKADPYPIYAALRQEGALHRRTNARDGSATHFVLRYEQAAAVLRDQERFVKDYRNTLTREERAELPLQEPMLHSLSRHMLNSDAPEHTRLRALASKAFSVRTVEQLEERMQQIADRLLDDLHNTLRQIGQADLIEAYAFPLPMIVIADLLGIPAQDRNRFRAWSRALVQPTPSHQRNEQKAAKSQQLMLDFVTYLRRILNKRRRQPRPDLITSLLQAEEQGDVLSEDEIFSTLLLLIVVGHETSVNLIGNGMLTLFTHRRQMEGLRQTPALLPNAVEELIRYDGPVERAPMRFARQDTWFEDTLIRRGDAVSVVLAAANRDPACFPDPDQLELERTPNRHLGFGLGPHYCLGAALARLEGKIGIGTLLEQLPGLQLAAPLDTLHWHTNPIMRGLRHLPVCLST